MLAWEYVCSHNSPHFKYSLLLSPGDTFHTVLWITSHHWAWFLINYLFLWSSFFRSRVGFLELTRSVPVHHFSTQTMFLPLFSETSVFQDLNCETKNILPNCSSQTTWSQDYTQAFPVCSGLNYIKQRLDVTNRMSTNDLRSLCVDKVMIFEPETLVDIPRTTQDSVSPDSPLAVFSLCCVLALNLLHQNQAGLHCRETWCVRSALLRRPRHTFSRGWQLGGCRTSLLRWNPNTVSRSWCLAVRTFKWATQNGLLYVLYC